MRALEIIGGGLSGLSLGRALRQRQVPVTIREAGEYPRHKVCGEFICGLRPSVAATLGLEPILQGALQHQRVAWHWKERRLRDDALPFPALGLSRHTLDERLARAFVMEGGELHTKSRVDPAEIKPGRIWATGRRGADKSTWFGLKVHCRGIEPAADLEFHFGEGAYVGVSRVENDEVNVCGLFRKRSGVRSEPDQVLPTYLRLCGLARLATRVEAHHIPDTRSAVAAITFDRAIPADRPVIGDAFAMIPPFTGDGMAMAFESAALVLDAFVAYARGEMDWAIAVARSRAMLQRHFRRRLLLASVMQRALVTERGQIALSVLARRGLLPFGLLFRWLH